MSKKSLPIFALKTKYWHISDPYKTFFKAITRINFDTPINRYVLLIMIWAHSVQDNLQT